MTILKFGGFWSGTGSISWNLVVYILFFGKNQWFIATRHAHVHNIATRKRVMLPCTCAWLQPRGCAAPCPSLVRSYALWITNPQSSLRNNTNLLLLSGMICMALWRVFQIYTLITQLALDFLHRKARCSFTYQVRGFRHSWSSSTTSLPLKGWTTEHSLHISGHFCCWWDCIWRISRHCVQAGSWESQ